MCFILSEVQKWTDTELFSKSSIICLNLLLFLKICSLVWKPISARKRKKNRWKVDRNEIEMLVVSQEQNYEINQKVEIVKTLISQNYETSFYL